MIDIAENAYNIKGDIALSFHLHFPDALVQSATHVAMKDDVIPLGTPFVDKNGKQHSIEYTSIMCINTFNRARFSLIESPMET